MSWNPTKAANLAAAREIVATLSKEEASAHLDAAARLKSLGVHFGDPASAQAFFVHAATVRALLLPFATDVGDSVPAAAPSRAGEFWRSDWCHIPAGYYVDGDGRLQHLVPGVAP